MFIVKTLGLWGRLLPGQHSGDISVINTLVSPIISTSSTDSRPLPLEFYQEEPAELRWIPARGVALLAGPPCCARAAMVGSSGFELFTPNKHLIHTTYTNYIGTVLPIRLLKPLRNPPAADLRHVENSRQSAVKGLFVAVRKR
jgi:hypothetical protein